jgi:hypothetical protein
MVSIKINDDFFDDFLVQFNWLEDLYVASFDKSKTLTS